MMVGMFKEFTQIKRKIWVVLEGCPTICLFPRYFPMISMQAICSWYILSFSQDTPSPQALLSRTQMIGNVPDWKVWLKLMWWSRGPPVGRKRNLGEVVEVEWTCFYSLICGFVGDQATKNTSPLAYRNGADVSAPSWVGLGFYGFKIHGLDRTRPQ